MGRLANYFMTLSNGKTIDPAISNFILSGGFAVDSSKGKTIIEVPVTRIDKYCAAYLPWGQRTVSCISVDKFEDVISRPFGGCYMARIPNKIGKYEYYHIHTSENKTEDRKSFWNNKFIPILNDWQHEFGAVLFRPNPYTDRKHNMNFETWGIISTCGKCLSVLVYKENKGAQYRKIVLEETNPLRGLKIPISQT